MNSFLVHLCGSEVDTYSEISGDENLANASGRLFGRGTIIMRWPRSTKACASSTPDFRQSRSGSISCRQRSEETNDKRFGEVERFHRTVFV